MDHIGQMFRIKREGMKLSLKEVENAISIRRNFLQAIEEGKIQQFLASVYVLGFMKQYAYFLDLDIEKLLRDHPKAFTFESKEHEFSYGIGTLEKRGSHGGGMKWIPNLLWAIGAVALVVLTCFLSKIMGLL